MMVTNVGNEPQQFWGFNQRLKDAAGREYSNDNMAEASLDVVEDGYVDEWNTINPSSSREYAVVFDVPTGAQPSAIELHDSPASSGVTVKL